MTKRPRYTDDFRASAVLMLEAAGYTGNGDSKLGSLQAVSNKTRVPSPTLRRWYLKHQNPPPDDLVINKKIDFQQLIEDEMAAILGEMRDARGDAAYNHLATAFGILFDKRQLISGGATDNQNQQILIKYAD